jgi:hypothetical protein
MLNIDIPMDLVEILKSFEAQIPGTEFRYVGGCIRDTILGIKPKDWDIVTDASPEQLESLGLPKVGKDFPVFLYQHPTYGQIEIACCRTERKVGTGHNGFEVKVCKSFEEDLKRRDLTINAVAWHHKNGGTIYSPVPLELLEYDFENHVLCHVSPAFAEDPLRVLRVARFQAKLSCQNSTIQYFFSVDTTTLALMASLKDELNKEPVDRVKKEFESVMLGSNPKNIYLFFATLYNSRCGDWYREICTTMSTPTSKFYIFPETCKQRVDALYLHFAEAAYNLAGPIDTKHMIAEASCKRLKLGLVSEMKTYLDLRTRISEFSLGIANNSFFCSPQLAKMVMLCKQLNRGKFPAHIYFDMIREMAAPRWFMKSNHINYQEQALDMFEYMYLAFTNLKFNNTQTPQEIFAIQTDCVTEFVEIYCKKTIKDI